MSKRLVGEYKFLESPFKQLNDVASIFDLKYKTIFGTKLCRPTFGKIALCKSYFKNNTFARKIYTFIPNSNGDFSDQRSPTANIGAMIYAFMTNINQSVH